LSRGYSSRKKRRKKKIEAAGEGGLLWPSPSFVIQGKRIEEGLKRKTLSASFPGALGKEGEKGGKKIGDTQRWRWGELRPTATDFSIANAIEEEKERRRRFLTLGARKKEKKKKKKEVENREEKGNRIFLRAPGFFFLGREGLRGRLIVFFSSNEGEGRGGEEKPPSLRE